jgi:hypothetical protein
MLVKKINSAEDSLRCRDIWENGVKGYCLRPSQLLIKGIDSKSELFTSTSKE